MEYNRLPLFWRLKVFCFACLEKELGRAGETAASYFLRWKKLFIVERNWRSRSGEIDLMAVTRQNRLVCVEVKTTLADAPSAWSRVDSLKEEHLVRTTQDYIRAKGLNPGLLCRFDVVIVLGDPRKLKSRLHFIWSKNVF